MKKPAIKSKAISVKNHVNRNRGKYSALAPPRCSPSRYSRKQWTEFLIEKGIDPMEFFNPERFSELNS